VIKLNEIEFGKARAELEGARYPELLEKGYIDHGIAYEELKSGEKFLVLGHKGCGKSAIGEKLRLEEKDKAVSIVHLEDFPYKSFGKIFSGGAETESKYPATWSWILLLLIIDSLRKDPGARDAVNIDYNNAISELCKLGFLPTTDIKRLIIQSSKTTFKAQIPKILEYSKESTSIGSASDLQFIALVDFLKNLVVDYSTEGGLILVIDGLDDILTKREVQYQALSALIFEVDRLNLFLFQKRKNIHIIILCRTELYERLPGTNKNKLRQDSALELNWYQDPHTPENSDLVKLVNLRARISAERDIDVFEEYFPTKIDGKRIEHYLLDMTRHTPRDFISLMNTMKNYVSDRGVTKKDVMSALRKYSIDYFEPEIRDEIVGYVDSKDYEDFRRLIGVIRQREFSYDHLLRLAKEQGCSETAIRGTLRALFDCGAIGNKWRTPSGSNRYEFKYRNKNSSFDDRKTIVLHKGLWKAMNLV